MTEEEAAELRDRVSLELDRLMTGNYKVVDTFTEFVKNECDESFRAGRESAEKRPTKAIMTALGKVFAAEIDGAIDGLHLPFQSGAKIYWQLVKDGLLRRAEVTLPGFLPVTVRGFMLTPKGHFLYCANCEREVEA